jgi:hypothetical protein
MKKFGGIYIGTGTAALTIGLGFEPDEVEIFNIGEAEAEHLRWNRLLQRGDTAFGGIIRKVVAGDVTLMTQDDGIMLYSGGERIATASVYKIISANLVAAYQGDMSAKGTTPITTWTLGSAANGTGNWNAECSTTYVGVGSEIFIRAANSDVVYRRTITALTSNGDQANEVTLDQQAPSGTIEKISYFADFVTCPAGMIMPAGITINEVATVNVASQPCGIIASQWDGKL